MHYFISDSHQTLPHYSLIGLMYGQQYAQFMEIQGPETIQQEALISHIADFCDCV